MASMKQVSRSLFLMLTQTPGWSSRRLHDSCDSLYDSLVTAYLTTSVWPDPAAYIRGTQPRQLRVFTSSPCHMTSFD